jgi:acyl dehydratase
MTADTRPAFAVGMEIPTRTVTISRETVAMFCGASLDYAGPHISGRIARSVGWPDLIAHRALITAKALSLLDERIEDPTAVVDIRTRYVKPVVVPDDDVGAVLLVRGEVTGRPEPDLAEMAVTVTSPQGELLATIRVLVRLR